MRLKDKIALVTGGSRGLGRSIAERLSDRGAVTVICGRHEEDLATAAGSIPRCSHVVADVTSLSDVREMFQVVKSRLGRIDILVNNAGVGVYGPLLEMTEEDLDAVMSVNLKGAFFCAREAARVMREQGRGCILNILSGAAESGYANLSLYCASKHALAGLSKTMTLELAPLGIRVLSASPGYIRTGFYADFPQGYRMPDDAPGPDIVAESIVNMLEESPAKGMARDIARRTKKKLLG